MDYQSQQDDLRKIRILMERSSIYHSLSGLSGIAAGTVGILAYAFTYFIVLPLLNGGNETGIENESSKEFIGYFLLISAASLALAFGGIFYFNFRKSKKNSLSFFDSSMQKLFINLFIPLIAGGVYCIVLIMEENYLLIAPTMLVFYGLGMINASRHYIIEIRYLGLIELLLGLTALFFKENGLTFWVIGFGAINIGYGLYIYVKYERKIYEEK